jgi:exopolysaccharide biosynthesis protein
MLIKDTRSTVTATGELFDAQSGVDPEGKHPRTAVATSSNGLLYFVVVDGRRSDATGINLKDLSTLLLDIGANDGMNLDGGGSSTFVTNSIVRNKPSDGNERAVSSIFCLR